MGCHQTSNMEPLVTLVCFFSATAAAKTLLNKKADVKVSPPSQHVSPTPPVWISRSPPPPVFCLDLLSLFCFCRSLVFSGLFADCFSDIGCRPLCHKKLFLGRFRPKAAAAAAFLWMKRQNMRVCVCMRVRAFPRHETSSSLFCHHSAHPRDPSVSCSSSHPSIPLRSSFPLVLPFSSTPPSGL